jgi:Leucine-rich repeat (LRR) protein
VLTSLTINSFADLDTCDLSQGKFETLTITNCAALTQLELASNPLTSLTVSNTPALDYINVDLTSLESLDLSGNALRKLYCRQTPLSSLDISGCTNLEELRFSYNNLSGSAVSGIFADLVANGVSDGVFTLEKYYPELTLTTQGAADKATLEANGWTITFTYKQVY